MSKVIYSSDYINIVGEIVHKKVNFKDSIESTEIKEIKSIYRLRLIFSLQINGKLKNFTHLFDLNVENPNIEISEALELVEWDKWYAIYQTLGELGYPIGKYDETGIGGNIIKSWIYILASDLH